GSKMKLLRRQFLHLAAGAAALPAVPCIAWAQAYPSRPVHWIVSFAAGGPHDIVARLVRHYPSGHLGQQFVIENRASATGNVGMQSALNSAGPPPPSRSTEKSWPHFRPSAVDFCGSRLAIGAATERARALAMPAGTRAQALQTRL